MAATRKPDQSELSFEQECTVHEKALTDFGTFFGSALIPFNASTLQPSYPLSFEGLIQWSNQSLILDEMERQAACRDPVHLGRLRFLDNCVRASQTNAVHKKISMMFRDQSADSKTKYLANQLAGQRHGHGIAGDSGIQITCNHNNGETSEAIRRVITDLRSMYESNDTCNHHEKRRTLFEDLNIPYPIPDPNMTAVPITAATVLIDMTPKDAIQSAAALVNFKRPDVLSILKNQLTSSINIGQFTQINTLIKRTQGNSKELDDLQAHFDEKSRLLQNRENLHNITVNGGTGSDGIVYRGLNFICKQLYSRIASVAESLHTLKKITPVLEIVHGGPGNGKTFLIVSGKF